MNTNKGDSPTINININGMSQANPINSEVDNREALWPWPWRWPRFPWPKGPFGPGPILRADGSEGSEMDEADLYFRSVTIGLSMKTQKGQNETKVNEDLYENVIPRLISARSIEEIDNAMKSAYKAYPNLKEQTHELYGDLGGNSNPGAYAKNPILWWIAKKAAQTIVKAIIIGSTTKGLK